MMKFIRKVINFFKSRYAPRGARLSFSGAGEDLIILDYLANEGIRNISYIDIGAHHPVYGNNTYLFYLRGGGGILIEPNPDMCKVIKSKRPQDICINAGIGREKGEMAYYTFERNTRNTFSKIEADAWSKQSGQVALTQMRQVLSLDEIMSTHFKEIAPDVISIDTEGYEIEILESLNWQIKPRVFCVEFLASSGVTTGRQKLFEIMSNNGYGLFAQTPTNVIFVFNK